MPTTNTNNEDEVLNDEVEETPVAPTPVVKPTTPTPVAPTPAAKPTTPTPVVPTPTPNNAEAERRRKRNLGF